MPRFDRLKPLPTVKSNPVPIMEDVLVYNAVPKCGSTTMTGLFNILAKRNGFSFKKYEGWRGYTSSIWSVEEQVMVTKIDA